MRQSGIEPASFLLAAPVEASSLALVELPITKQEGRYVFSSTHGYSLALTQQIQPGLIMSIYASDGSIVSGVVVDTANSQSEIQIFLANPSEEAAGAQPIYQKAKFKNWWNIARPVTTIHSYDFLTQQADAIALLKVFCLVPTDYTAGCIRWTLYAETNNDLISIASGNDYATPGICFISQPGYIWKDATYTLKAKRVDAITHNTAKSAFSTWVAAEPIQRLTYGRLQDNSSPLDLT
jgi:hypothetical protein